MASMKLTVCAQMWHNCGGKLKAVLYLPTHKTLYDEPSFISGFKILTIYSYKNNLIKHSDSDLGQTVTICLYYEIPIFSVITY